MNPFEQIREGMSRAWDTLAEGWHYLQDHAAQALTQFTPSAESTDES